ncbi:MAG TPA: tetratricopeptide repeat protein [Gammaproteobacteria bacterium]|nr:tetratricopeptide repeat protein [Gammaproteobacteria bacterium]HRA42859.1 tetratricopeptide repeat protein [Gammaproteobacteria bacterium]
MELKKINFIFLIIVLFFAKASIVFADEPEWVLVLKEKAKKGDADSQVELGKIYRGKVCLTDSKTKYRLCIYDNTPGVRANHFEAVNWFRQAAKQGDPKGQTELAFMYREGFGVRQDYTEALRWLRVAAEQNYGEAQVDIGTMYEEGAGVPKNCIIAKEWYGKACDNKRETGCLFYKTLNEKSRT